MLVSLALTVVMTLPIPVSIHCHRYLHFHYHGCCRTTPVTLELLRSLPLSAIKSTIVINSSSNAFTTITTTTVTNAAVMTLPMRVATKYQYVSKALAEVKRLRMTG